MRRAIDFDTKLDFRAVKIEGIRPNGILTSKSKIQALTGQAVVPELFLALWHVVA